MAEYSFDIPNRLIEVLDPTPNAKVDITIQELYDACVDFQDSPAMMSQNQMIFGSGKVDLGAGSSTVVTVQLLDGWRVKFEDHTGPDVVLHVISGGNLVGRVGDLASAVQDPIAPAPFVAVQISQATTGALLNIADLERLRKWVTNAQRLAEGSVANFEMWDDGADPDVDPPLETQDVTDKDGNAIVLPVGAPARRSEAT